MPGLPRKHIGIAAGFAAFTGPFFGLASSRDAEVQLRAQGVPYACAEAINWIKETFGRTASSAMLAPEGAIADMAFMKFVTPPDG